MNEEMINFETEETALLVAETTEASPSKGVKLLIATGIVGGIVGIGTLVVKKIKGKKENIDVQTWSYECAYYANGYPCFFDLGAMHFSPYHGNSIYVDVNGKKAPNKWGKDLFVFMIAGSTQNDIQQGTVIPYGSKQQALYKANNDYYWQESNLCTSTTIGEWLNNHCAGRVLEEDAMNY